MSLRFRSLIHQLAQKASRLTRKQIGTVSFGVLVFLGTAAVIILIAEPTKGEPQVSASERGTARIEQPASLGVPGAEDTGSSALSHFPETRSPADLSRNQGPISPSPDDPGERAPAPDPNPNPPAPEPPPPTETEPIGTPLPGDSDTTPGFPDSTGDGIDDSEERRRGDCGHHGDKKGKERHAHCDRGERLD